jgi:hypothetical protein
MGTGLQSIAPLRESRCEHLVALLELARRSRTLHAPLLGSGVEWAAPSGCGSLAFAAPSTTFTRRRAGPRGVSIGGWLQGTPSLPRALRRLGSSFRALLLRWALGPPLLALSACASPPTWALASTPGFPFGLPSAGSQPCVRSRSAFTVSHRPGGFLRSSFPSVFQPGAGPRFTRFPTWGLPCGRLPGRPPGAARTLRRMPLVDSRTASPQPLPSCPCLPLHVQCASIHRRGGRLLAPRVVAGRWSVG